MIHIPSVCPPPAPPHTGGEGEHRQAAGSSGGCAGPQGGDGVWGPASGGPEDPRVRHPPQHQLGQAEQAVPRPAKVRREPRDMIALMLSHFVPPFD